jgi:hypothetical protein
MSACKTNLIKQFIPARPFDLGEVFQQILLWRMLITPFLFFGSAQRIKD